MDFDTLAPTPAPVTDPDPSAVKIAFIRLSQEVIKAMERKAGEVASVVHSDLEK